MPTEGKACRLRDSVGGGHLFGEPDHPHRGIERRQIMGIDCGKTTCKHNEQLDHVGHVSTVCKRGAGYDYGGGDIVISTRGYCTSFGKRKVQKVNDEKH